MKKNFSKNFTAAFILIAFIARLGRNKNFWIIEVLKLDKPSLNHDIVRGIILLQNGGC